MAASENQSADIGNLFDGFLPQEGEGQPYQRRSLLTRKGPLAG